MHLYQQSISPPRLLHAITLAPSRQASPSMAGINNHRQMGFALQHRNRRYVEHIAIGCPGTNAPHASLEEDNIVIASGSNIFRRHQPFGNRRRHAAFEDDRLVDTPNLFQQSKFCILRVPIWITSTSHSRKVSSMRTSISSVTIGNQFVGGMAEILQPLLPKP